MPVSDTRDDRGLRGFMDRGGLWRFLLVLVVYFAVYLGAGLVTARLGGHYTDDDLLSSLGSVFVQVTAALVVGAVVLVALSVHLGWTHELFGRQPIYRSWWMWIAPLVVLTPIVLRVLGIDWGGPSPGVVALVLLTGLLIGFVEELTFRGLGVKMLRDGGHGEWTVAALSSLLFALSHGVNLLGGQSLRTVGPTVLYTFAFGVLMYLSLRSIGFLAGAMVLHGLTDPTSILASGGIDKVTDQVSSDPLVTAAGVFTAALIVIGLVLLAFVRGRVSRGSAS
jgi:hypothetical protein